MRNAGLDEALPGTKTAWRNINNLRCADDTTFSAEREDELKRLLMKEESEKAGLKLNIEKTNITNWFHHFIANRWGNNGNWEILFWGAPESLQMVTAAMKLKDAYSLEEKLWPTYIAY